MSHTMNERIIYKKHIQDYQHARSTAKQMWVWGIVSEIVVHCARINKNCFTMYSVLHYKLQALFSNLVCSDL